MGSIPWCEHVGGSRGLWEMVAHACASHPFCAQSDDWCSQKRLPPSGPGGLRTGFVSLRVDLFIVSLFLPQGGLCPLQGPPELGVTGRLHTHPEKLPGTHCNVCVREN